MEIVYFLVASVILLFVLMALRSSLKKGRIKIPGFEASVEAHDLPSNGGRGGNAKVVGISGTAIGGRGGSGGPGGKGGDGGDVEATGDNSFAMGGEGGEAGQIDRGGKGGRGPLRVLKEDHPEIFKDMEERFGPIDDSILDAGRGGDGSGPVAQ